MSPSVATEGQVSRSLRRRLFLAAATVAAWFAPALAAAPLELVESPSGSELHHALVEDAFNGVGSGQVDEWSFEGEAGDLVSVRIESAEGAARPRLRLTNTLGTDLQSVNGGTDGVAAFDAYRITTPGTYRVRTYTEHLVSDYALRVELARGLDLEKENNNSHENATVLTPQAGAGSFDFVVGGLLPAGDAADTFSLGVAPAGSSLDLELELPDSTLTDNDVRLQVFEERPEDGALDFNGSTYAVIPHNDVIDAIEVNSALTIEAWVYIRSWPQSYFNVFDKYQQAGDWGWVFSIQNSGGGISFWSSSNARASSNVTPSTNAWHHVAVAYDHAADEIRFYLDGLLVASDSSPGPLFDTSTDGAYLGYGPSSSSNDYSNGKLAEVRLWNRALTSEEIAASFSTLSPDDVGSGLVGHWTFDEGSGLTAADSSGEGNDAVLGGGEAGRVPSWAAGTIRSTAGASGTALSHTFDAETPAWVQVQAADNRGISARYLLTGSLSDESNLQVTDISLPPAGGVTRDWIQSFTITFDDELNAASANNVANYQLVGAGPDGDFGTEDDISYSFASPGYVNGRTVTLTFTNGPLQPGEHRLTLGLGLRDRAGNTLGATYTLPFRSEHLGVFRIENQDNNTRETATPLDPLVADSDGSIIGARGNLSAGSDVDYFTFSANAGDRLILFAEAPGVTSAASLRYRIYAPNYAPNASEILSMYTGSDGVEQRGLVLTETGTYTLLVSSNNTFLGEYRAVISLQPAISDIEVEANNDRANARALTWTSSGPMRTAAVTGMVAAKDPADWYALGHVDAGTEVTLSVSRPESSQLVWVLDLLDANGEVLVSGAAGDETLSYTLPNGKSGNLYARLRADSGAGPLSRYLIEVSLGDLQPPAITSSTLPTEGSELSDFFGTFQLTFSENLSAASVNDSARYRLAAAGDDETFGTPDDVLYTVITASTYSSGLSQNYRLSDGPLQPGRYRFEVTGLVDLYGNEMTEPFVRHFTIKGVEGYVLESRSNDTLATATNLPLVASGSGFVVRARGHMTPGDLDFYTFEATADDRVILNVFSAGSTSGVSLHYRLRNPSGQEFITFYSGSDGAEQREFIAPETGIYSIRVSPNNTHSDEYRIVVSIQPGSYQLESEANNGAGSADSVTWTPITGARTAEIGGILNDQDASDGDWFALGHLETSTSLTLSATQSSPSDVVWILEVIRGSSVVSASSAGATSLEYLVPAGASGTYYARIRPASGNGPLAGYVLSLTLSDTSAPTVTSDTLPAEGAAVPMFLGNFQLTFSEVLTSATVNDPANYDLRAAGADGNFGSDDDVVYPLVLSATYSGGLNASYRISAGPLQPGLYQFRAYAGGLEDLYGNTLASDYVRSFSIIEESGYVLESNNNHSFATATSLGELAPDGDGFLGRGRGYLTTRSEHDYFSFTALEGDRVMLTSENFPSASVNSGLGFRIFGPDQQEKLLVTSNDGRGQGGFIATESGTYYVRVSENHIYLGEYRFTIAVFPEEVEIETESNDSATTADQPQWTTVPGLRSAHIGAVLHQNDGSDWFALGSLAAGTEVTVDATKPPSSSLVWLIDLMNGNTVVATSAAGAASFHTTIASHITGGSYIRVRPSSGAGVTGYYRINIRLSDTNAPMVVSDTLPADGGVATTFVDRFSLTFSKDMDAATVNNLVNYDLRSAGPDDEFDTADDVPIALTMPSPYSNGVTASFRIAHLGPLVEGRYRLKVLSGLVDRSGNALSPVHTKIFRVGALGGFTYEAEPNGTAVTATPLAIQSSQPGLLGAGGRGYLSSNSDVDLWSFTLEAGDRFYVLGETVGSPVNSGLSYKITSPGGGTLASLSAANNGDYAFNVVTAPESGTYLYQVSYNHTYYGEYRFRIYVMRGDAQVESEPNDSRATADVLTLAADGEHQRATVTGISRVAGDLDYFNLGTISAGKTVFLSTRQPTGSSFVPVVSLYNASGQLMSEYAGGRAGDGVAQVNLSTAGTYYALIRTSGQTSGLESEYLLDVLVVPTADISYPNLQVTSLTPLPASGLKSGNPVPVTFRVENLGNLATGAVTWIDRLVLSTDQVYGNADDIELGVFPRTGPLAAGGRYTVNETLTLPHGILGSYYLIARTDHTDTVAEFILEADNETVTDAPVSIALADYPDLVVEDLIVSEPDTTGARTATWTLANRGLGTAKAGHTETVRVRNTTTGTVLSTTSTVVATDLATDGALQREATFTATAAGNYVVEVIVDIDDERYELNEEGHVAAEENNTSTATFSIVRMVTLTLAAEPAGAGTVEGAGSFPAGTSRTVTATPIGPHVFVGWFENQLLRSVEPSYTSILSDNRTLTARFTLPSVQITTSVIPTGTGVVTGGGTHAVGSEVTLGATALPGYRFDHWSEAGATLGSETPLVFTATASRAIQAHFAEANPTHVLTTGTIPQGITSVTGTGTYTNGQTAVISAPESVTVGDTEYVFVRFLLNGVPISTERTLNKTFTTQDAPTFAYVAEYSAQALNPTVTHVMTNAGDRVGITQALQVTIRFDRAMKTAVRPVVDLVSSNATARPSVPAAGAWTSSDTYVTPAITVGPDHGGNYRVRVSAAQDVQGRTMNAVELYPFVVDVTVPALPTLTKGATTPTSATVTWSDYAAPTDLASFRVYRSAESFTSVAGLSPITSLTAGARAYTFDGLTVDTDYHVAIVPVDTVGNAPVSVQSFLLRIGSELPPAVPFEVRALATDAAQVTWSFDPTTVAGFKGFRVYRESSPFTSIEGLSPFATFGADARSFDDSGLNRAQAYHYAVVAFNNLGESRTDVISKPWKDPLSGTLTTDFLVTESLLVIHEPLTIAAGATLTVPAGTTIAFAPGAGLTVEAGRLIADGTVFAPVVFTSLADVDDAGPTRGSWTGITLADPARPSVLRHAWIKYGMGLGIVAGNHTVDTLGAAWNELAGINLSDAVTLETSAAYLVNNTVGARVEDGASLTLTGSVIKNNGTNAAIVGAGTINASGNWWGTADSAAIAASLAGPVAIGSPLPEEPILTRGLRTADGSDTTGSAEPELQLASLNASAYRVSEDPSFAGVLFSDVPRDPLSPDLFNTTAWTASVTLSEGAGLKTLHAQFRSPTGTLSEPVSFQLNYVTTAPVIGALSLTDGQVITRPIEVTASATSALPLESLTLTVNGEAIATSTTGTLAVRWDVRDLAPGQYQVRLLARDNAGGVATRTIQVIVSPTPPPAPVIRTPVSGTTVTTNSITVAGDAEPFASVRIHRNGAAVATVEADADGLFSADAVPLLEGVNTLTAVAFDAVGNTASPVVSVAVDSGAPAPVTLLPLVYNVGEGVFVDWDLPLSGEVPVAFRVLWHDAPFTTAAAATGQSALLSSTHVTLKDIPDGLRYFAVVGYDSVGNASPLSNVRSFHVDQTLPSFSIVFDQTMPVGPGDLTITVTASEPLQAPPLVLMRLQDRSLVSIKLSAAGGNTYSVTFPVTALSAKSGVASIGITGTDLAGNTFVGAPSGPELVFDLTKPTGVVTTSLSDPVRTTEPVDVTVSLTLSEAPKTGTTPSLSFSPPDGEIVPLTLAGSGLNWVAGLTLTPEMGDGIGTFLLNVQDAVGNAGTVITAGEHLELYTGEAPSATTAPAIFNVQPLAGGIIRLTWSAVDKAHSYRIYREPGASAALPTTLVAEGVTDLTYDDLPPADGPYRYVVRAYRLGAESAPSGVRATVSDRTPPAAPDTTNAQLGASGIQISWTPGDGEAPAKWVVYRNDVAIGTTNVVVTSFTDAPPRGVMTYRVAAADALGNEARGPSATLELQVGAVSQLTATVEPGFGTTLTWMSSDATVTGFNVYRNGAKQNSSPLTSPVYTDTFDSAGQPVSYVVKAVNASGAESVGRSVLVQPLSASIRLNPTEDGDLVSVARYFDTYAVTFTVGAAASQDVLFDEGEFVRVVAGELPVEARFALPETVAANETTQATVVVPAPNVAGAEQGVSITLRGLPDAGGSVVQYRVIQDFEGGQASGLMMTLSAETQPLAGALTNFKVRVFNRGHAPVDLVLSRGDGTEPGELELHITNADGVLVSTTLFQNSVPGAIINAQGDAFLRVESGDYVDIPFNDVLVSEGLGGQSLTFRARFKTIYHAVGSAFERTNGPLEGTMASTATATPYYATAQTTQSQYSDEQAVVIFGQALDRDTHQPVPNVKVRVGLRVRGAVLEYEVTTDDAGSYEHTYTPSLGLAGEISVWASHPDVVDQLDQVSVRFYRLYTKPGRVEAVMTKNDRLDFDVTLVNPSDLTLTSPTVSFRAFRIENGTEVNVPGLTGTARTLPSSIAPRAEPRLGLRMQATLDVPDDAQFEFTINTAQGATTRLAGTVSFRPALAVLTTVSPTNGYAEAGVGRGQIKSVDVTVENRGLRDLTGVKLVAPANVAWMQVNLAPDPNGDYPMADIPVGGSRHFTVVFAPPADTPVGFYNDFLLIRGENSTGDYRLNLFATVTSEQKGAVQFEVTNTFGQPVPNASVWLRNPALMIEVGPLTTDVNGQAVAPSLMEGDWQWKTQAAGHGATTGLVTVIPEQTVGVETELTVSMVTVKFSVVPVPFTDYYEIKIEQTFQTRTPIPNLVMTPPHRSLNIEPGWTGTLMYTLRNEGLRSMFDVVVTEMSLPTMRVTPMVSFIPEIKAQQSIEIPVYFEYFGPPEGGAGDEDGLRAAAFEAFSSGRGETSGKTMMAMAGRSSSGGAAAMDMGPIDDFLDCYEEFKYGTISFKAEGGISSVSGKPYTVGANATIDVDELLALFCDGECPDRVTGGGVVGALCGKLVSKVVEQAGKKTKVIDTVCKAANIIKAVACAAAQLPSGHVQKPPPPPPNSSTGGGKLASPGSFRERWEIIGGGCFVAGTPITLADGSTLPIEQIAQGARLLAAPTGRADAVAEVMFLSSDHVREISFRALGARNAQVSSLRLTHDHRVWVDGRGWTFAANVQAGDWLHGSNGGLYEVTANNRLPGRHDVYGLHMASDNVIYAAGILTEDQCFQETPQFRVSPQTGGVR